MTQTPRVEDVIGYLRAHGWAVAGQWRNAGVWSWQEFEVLVPASDGMADTTVRLGELVRCVASAEGRSPREVRRDMASPATDVVSYRMRHPSESVTLPAGTRVVCAVRDLIVTCAREVSGEPRPPTRDKAAEDVRALLGRTLLSVIDEEPFGLDVLLPLEHGDGDSLGRRTSRRVLQSSAAVLRAARSSDTDAFEQLLAREVSEAACVALADLAGPDRTTAFELRFRWSSVAPLANEAVEFPQGVGQRIRVPDRRARQMHGNPPGVVVGPVTGLSDDERGDRWRIKVRGVLEVDGAGTGRQRLVTVRLGNAQDYKAALAAHRDGRVVRAEGAVSHAARTPAISTAAGGFTVIDHTEM